MGFGPRFSALGFLTSAFFVSLGMDPPLINDEHLVFSALHFLSTVFRSFGLSTVDNQKLRLEQEEEMEEIPVSFTGVSLLHFLMSASHDSISLLRKSWSLLRDKLSKNRSLKQPRRWSTNE